MEQKIRQLAAKFMRALSVRLDDNWLNGYAVTTATKY